MVLALVSLVDRELHETDPMRLHLAVAALLLSSCAVGSPASGMSSRGDLAELLIGADLNVTDPAVNRKVSQGAIVAASLDGCVLSVTSSDPPSSPLTIDLGQLLFLYEDDHDDSIGLVQRGSGQPAVSFFTAEARYAETLRALEVASEACGSRPGRSEPFVSAPSAGMPGAQATPRGG
jgi:hypothetical protein